MVENLSYLPYDALMVIFGYGVLVIAGVRLFTVANIFFKCQDSHLTIWGEKLEWILLCFRLLCFAFFLGNDVIYNQVVQPPNWWYFTLWNVYLTVGYFLLTSISSILSIIYGKKIYSELPLTDSLGKAIVLIYAAWGASAFYVTVLNFTLLSPEMDYWNVSEHLITTITVVIEMSVNALDVRPIQFLCATSWVLLYVFFIWAVVGEGLRGWPYFFLDASSTSSFGWYGILFFLDIVFFIIWWALHRLKWYLVGQFCPKPTETQVLPEATALLPTPKNAMGHLVI